MQFSASAEAVSHNAGETLKATDQASQATDMSSRIVQDNAQAIHLIGQEMDQTSAQVMTLNERSSRIGGPSQDGAALAPLG